VFVARFSYMTYTRTGNKFSYTKLYCFNNSMWANNESTTMFCLNDTLGAVYTRCPRDETNVSKGLAVLTVRVSLQLR
jgi:hypothetical protein